jgi:hypothetical protein
MPVIRIKPRVILTSPTEDLGLALRAANWLLRQPMTQKDAILAYGDENDVKKYFYVRRTKTGVSVQPFSRAIRRIK